MIRSKVAKSYPEAADEGLVLVIMTEKSGIEWCKKNLLFSSRDGVKQTVYAEPRGSRCKVLFIVCNDSPAPNFHVRQKS